MAKSVGLGDLAAARLRKKPVTTLPPAALAQKNSLMKIANARKKNFMKRASY